MPQIKLIKKTKKKQLAKRKNKNTDNYHQILDHYLKLYSDLEVELNKPVANKIYHHEERMPPNDFKVFVTVKSSSGYSDNKMPAAVFLQYLISEKHICKRKPLYDSWFIVGKKIKRKTLKRRK